MHKISGIFKSLNAIELPVLAFVLFQNAAADLKWIKKLQSFVNRRLRYILEIFWPNKIDNDDLWQCRE